MAELRAAPERTEPILRREVIVPNPRDAVSLHRTIAILSICIAILAGMIDAMLWQAAQREAAEARLEAVIQAERAAQAEARAKAIMIDDSYVVRDAGDESPSR